MSELQDRINAHFGRDTLKPINVPMREKNIVRHYDETIVKGWMTLNAAAQAVLANIESKKETPTCTPRSVKF